METTRYLMTDNDDLVDTAGFEAMKVEEDGSGATVSLVFKDSEEELGWYWDADEASDALAAYVEALERQGEPCYITKDHRTAYRLRQFKKFSLEGSLEDDQPKDLSGIWRDPETRNAPSLVLDTFPNKAKAMEELKAVAKALSLEAAP